MLFSFFVWWYGPGWVGAMQDVRRRTEGVSHSFSVAILLKTLFAPWRRITSTPGAGIDAKFRAMIDNLVSRAVGFFVRLIVLITALLLSGLTAVFFTLIMIVWPLLPFLVLYSLVRAVTG